MAAATVNGGDGIARPFMRESEGEGEGRVSGVGSIQMSVVSSSAASTRAGRQEVAGARARAC